MMLSFTLSMPNRNSWNGRWSGENQLYVKTHNFGRTHKGTEHAQQILDKGYFHYNFGDGWSAGISVKQVGAKEASSLRKKSAGFCGYEWMIQSILDHGKIQA